MSPTSTVTSRFPLILFCILLLVGCVGDRAAVRGKSNALGLDHRITQFEPATQVRLLESYGARPLSFEANVGQTDSRVKFLTHGLGYSVFLTSNEAVVQLAAPKQTQRRKVAAADLASRDRETATPPDAVVRMRLVGANPRPQIAGLEPLRGKNNYFVGNDAGLWRKDLPVYQSVRYANVYPGIDVRYYGNQRQLEYDFVLAPGADPGLIHISFAGVDEIRLEPTGDLALRIGDREIHQQKPFVFEAVGSVRHEVSARYMLDDRGGVALNVGNHDPQSALVIDPAILYSTYLGGSDVPFGARTIAVDSTGSVYVAGSTTSTVFPTTAGALRRTNNGGTPGSCDNCDAFVTKFDAGGAIVYSTYLGGHGTNDISAIAVDSAGEAYVIGSTLSTDYPTTPGAFQPDCTKYDTSMTLRGWCNAGFVTKLNASGSGLVFSTYLAGAGVNVTGYGTYPVGLALDSSRNVFIAGSTSPNFPLTPGVFQPAYTGTYITGFVAKMNSTGTALIYSSYLGGRLADGVSRIATDASGNAYVTGQARSPDFPTTPGAFQRTCPIVEVVGGCSIAFVTKINSGGTSILYSTFLGGRGPGLDAINGVSSDVGGIAVDRDGFAYVAGQSYTTDFPTTPGSVKPTTTSRDAFVSKLNLDGTALVYSTNLGGDTGNSSGANGFEEGHDIAVNLNGEAYVVGATGSVDFPVANAVQPTFGGGARDAFVVKLNAAGAALMYSTYLGGRGYDQGFAIAIDAAGAAYVAGITDSNNFPLARPAQSELVGTTSSFVAKIGEPSPEARGDLAVYRPSTGTWYILKSNSDYTSFSSMQWGASTDIPVPGDYDDDGKADLAVYRPSTGTWYVLLSSSNYTTYLSIAWGTVTDVPVPGDYDGDGKADLAVYRPSTGTWYVLQSGSNYTTFISTAWGTNTDTPVPGDYDGDGKIDFAVYRPSNGVWYVLRSSSNYMTSFSIAWGASTDILVPGDYDGDGKADVAVYRPSTGVWWVLRSSTNNTTFFSSAWGSGTDIPLPGDYDGDGKADLAVYRPSTGNWSILRSSSAYTTSSTFTWGTNTDVPLRPIGKAPAPPGTAVIGFNSLAGDGSTFGASAESGFTMFSTSNPAAPNVWKVSTSFGHPAPFVWFLSRAGATVQNQVRITAHGSVFTFNAVDLYSSTAPISYTFVGVSNTATVFTVNGAVPNPMGAFVTVMNGFATSAIDTLLITLSNTSAPCCANPVGLDNIVVTR